MRSWLDMTEERISELEHISIEAFKTEKQKEQTERGTVVTRHLGKREDVKLLFNQYRASVWDDHNDLRDGQW